eukprot:2447191-Rhodomonas_salina.1
MSATTTTDALPGTAATAAGKLSWAEAAGPSRKPGRPVPARVSTAREERRRPRMRWLKPSATTRASLPTPSRNPAKPPPASVDTISPDTASSRTAWLPTSEIATPISPAPSSTTASPIGWLN